MTIWHYILSAKLTKTHSFRLLPTGVAHSGNYEIKVTTTYSTFDQSNDRNDNIESR